MTQLQQGGAKIVLSSQTPTIDLVSLVEQVTDAIRLELPSAEGKLPEGVERLFSLATAGRQAETDAPGCSLTVNTAAVLHRLVHHPDFQNKFRDGGESGFIRDRETVPRGRDTIVGGKVHAEKVQELPQAVAALRDAVEQALDACLERQGIELSGLLRHQAGEYMENLGRQIRAKSPGENGTTTIAALRFSDPEGRQRPANKAKHVARLFSAREEVHTEWLTGFLNAAKRKLERQGLEPDEMEAVLDNFRQEAELPTSQTTRFLNFLEDEAMARVRIEVCFAFMRAVRDEAARHAKTQDKALIHYISNILKMKECFVDTEKALVFELGGLFEGVGAINLSDRMRGSLFYTCLPIWPQPRTQLFESRKGEDNALVREVSYRFRINGTDPQTGLTAMNRRLNEIEDIIQRHKDRKDAGRLEKALAQLFYLSLIVPNGEKPEQHFDIQEKCDRLKEFIAKSPGNCTTKLIDRLQKQETNGTMQAIVDQLIHALRQHGGAAMEKARHRVEDLYICVQQGAVDWERLAAATGRTTDFFVQPGEGGKDEKVAWFEHIQITDNPEKVPSLLFSVRIRTRLLERILYCEEEAGEELRLLRKVEGDLLPVGILSSAREQTGASGSMAPLAHMPDWCCQAAVNILVFEDQISIKQKNRMDYTSQQLRAASATALTLLTFTVLWTIRRRLARRQDDAPAVYPRMLLLRVQREGKKGSGEDASPVQTGSEVLYAVAHALQLALSEEGQVFMQGMVLKGVDGFKKAGVYNALHAGFPLVLESRGFQATEPVGLINYTTRPCSQHADSSENRYLFTTKTYLARPTETPLTAQVLEEDKTRMSIHGQDDFMNPHLIFEEMARLENRGCRHVLLLWQHYGGRHIGMAADRHAAHSRPDFLDRLAERFPAITVYMLRRDDFPALRVSSQGKANNGFEVARVSDHEHFRYSVSQEGGREIIPFYTFATLAVVGKNADADTKRPQSGFCTYFLELDARLSMVEWAERARANLIDPNRDSIIRPALIGVLRGLHYLHAEKPARNNRCQPVLRPYDWIAPADITGAGEFRAMQPRGRGSDIISLPAVLTHVGAILRGTRS